jgi:hypothetical protein
MTTTHTPFTLGSVSTGTLRTQDLLPAFANALADLEGNRNRPLIVAADGEIDYESERASFLLGDMQDALEVSCPPFVFFGAHPGDGADFGFWPDMEAMEAAEFDDSAYKDDGMMWIESSQVWIHQDDHGNITVMDMDRNVLWTTT